MPVGLPSSLLRQHAIRYSQGNISLESYREKRTQIINNIVDMHIPTARSTLIPALADEIPAGTHRRSLLEDSLPSLTPSHIVLLSVMSFTAASMSILPNARMTLAAISSTMALASPVVATAESDGTESAADNFLTYADELALKSKWEESDIDNVVSLWMSLDNEQRYSARRYTSYHKLLSSAADRATEFRELAEVSNLSGSLELKAQQVDRVTRALLIH